MQRPLSVFVGLRFTRSKNANKFLSFISWVSTAGLILGVAALIVVTSVLNGFEAALANRILGMVPQVTVQASQPLADWRPFAQQLAANDSNVIATAPFVQARGMISVAGEVNSTILNGIEPDTHAKVSILKDSMIAGDFESLTSGSGNIILGEYVVDKHGLQLGDKVGIILSKPSDSTVGMTPTFHTYTLTGIFHVSHDIDKWMSYIAMDDASDVLGIAHGAAGIRLHLKDVFSAADSATQALNSVNNTYALLDDAPADLSFYSLNWTQSHGGLYSTIRMQKTVMSLLLFFIVLVAAFNVISMLVMSVTEKRAEVAILKTFGASSHLIARIFIIQGAIIGAVGVLVGLIVGLGITLSIHTTSAWVNTTFNLGLFDNYFVDALPANIEIWDVSLIVISAFVVILLSCLYPAYKAAHIEPVKILRGE